MSLPRTDFKYIVPHLGGQDEAFEELCCQNARHVVPAPQGEFVRYRGAGGDGGVECIWRLVNGKEWGWQVKYIFNLNSALSDLSDSIEVATRVHPQNAVCKEVQVMEHQNLGYAPSFLLK